MSVRKPMLLVFAGPNGSGKSTISQYVERIGEYTNADDIASSTGMELIEAAKFVDNKRYLAIKEKRDLTFETVLSSDYKLDILKKAKSAGYFIKCIFFLTVDPLINVARVESRVALGGHDVPRDKIISRYGKSLAHIKDLIDICDILHVYDNSKQPVRIIRKHKDDITLYPNKLWKLDEIIKLVQ